MNLRVRRVSAYLHGGDPAPGDVAQIGAVIGVLRTTTDEVGDALAVLDAIGHDVALWTGRSADAFRTTVGELRPRLVAAQLAYEGAADALHGWLRRLQHSQDDAVRVAAAADDAGAQLPQEQAVMHALGTTAPGLVPLQHRRDVIAQQATRDARECADRLAESIAAVKKYEHSMWHHLVDHIAELKEIIQKIEPWLAGATLIALAIPVVGEVIGPVLAAVTIGVAIVSEICSVVLLIDGRETLGEFATDTFWNAITLAAPGAKVISGSARAASALNAGSKAARGGAVEATRIAGAMPADSAAARTFTQAAGTDAHNAREFAKNAAAADADKHVPQATRKAVDDLLHPRQAHAEQKHLDEVIDHAQRYDKLPTIDRWLPPGDETRVLVGDGVTALDKYHTVDQSLDIPETVTGEDRQAKP
ncbi:hypothetical protein QEZ54_06675 [Catellatospora sp. KI3]|uniref:hypothetical protein n=1 Tax=Catellatospora sp. KI3 TaxID=3041620 RepID=UPI002482BFA3|nr:hypothetical protein [Catellatospora sp. KI3]MDI1460642.1 hypothetical protein [Catellatospora sp. KI3]